MQAHLDVPPDLLGAFRAAGVGELEPGSPSILAAPAGDGDWPSTLDALTGLYRKARAAAIEGSSVVFLVSSDALLGRSGALDAMAAMGVVSAARTLALELAKQGAVANCLASGVDTPRDETVQWSLRLLAGSADGPSGEVLQLGGAQIGKALS
jgi:NAD(P)-dependent dehydrogenase (short-subunit alcohol dehydrogenase family)